MIPLKQPYFKPGSVRLSLVPTSLVCDASSYLAPSLCFSSMLRSKQMSAKGTGKAGGDPRAGMVEGCGLCLRGTSCCLSPLPLPALCWLGASTLTEARGLLTASPVDLSPTGPLG